jgi:opacity protein-like surface antigen
MASAVDRELDLTFARKMLEQGQAKQAYAYLLPMEFRYAGNIEFDYWLAVAALEAGEPGTATLALERVLAVQPSFAQARLYLARAYRVLGDLPRARAQLDIALSIGLDESGWNFALQHLAGLGVDLSKPRLQARGFVEVAFGVDTNVNSATDRGNSTTLSPNNLKTEDAFTSVNGGGVLEHTFSPRLSTNLAVNFFQRNHVNETDFDTSIVEMHGRLALGQTRDRIYVGLYGELFDLDYEPYRRIAGADVEWQHARSANTWLNLFGLYRVIRYDEQALKQENFDQAVIGLGYNDNLRNQGLAFASLYAGKEWDTHDRLYGEKTLYGIRLGAEKAIFRDTTLYGSAGIQRGKFHEHDSEGVVRDDKRYDLTAGLKFNLSRRWSMRYQVVYVNNKSNIPFYDYDRTEGSVVLRYDFR